MRARILASKVFRKIAGYLRLAPVTPSLAERSCPICGYNGHFRTSGVRPRADAQCPRCSSLERHRLLKLLLESDHVGSLGKTLHFAPEPCLKEALSAKSETCVTCDLFDDSVDLQINIEAADIDDAEFDTVVCCHVLEHVDDVAAIAEVFRILKPGGLAILGVPIIEGWDETYENPAITDGTDRQIHFLQSDHVRLYGRDFRDRVRRAGFGLDEFWMGGRETVKYSLIPGERLFLARKPELTPA